MKTISLILLAVTTAGIAFFSGYGTLSQAKTSAPTIQEGDIIFQVSQSGQSSAIQLATGSKYSHMGVIYESDGQQYVLEAIQTVRLTPLQEWVQRGEEGHYVVKRLKSADNTLKADEIALLKRTGEQYLGKEYDSYFEWSDDKIYCSELVWKMYRAATGLKLGELQKLGNLDLSNNTVQQQMKERFGNDIPTDEMVISPGAMFSSPLLVTVIEN